MTIINKNIALAIAALVACGTAAATEDYDLRYAPGYGAADMSAPFEGGWVFQAHAYAYSGNIRGTTTQALPFSTINALNPAVPNIPGAFTTTTVHTNEQINVNGLLPRLSFMSATTFLGATVGGTMLLPLVTKKSNATITGSSTVATSPLPAIANGQIAGGVNPLVVGQVQNVASANSNSAWGTGDPEVSPILRWSTEATQTLFILTTVMPLGDYDKNRAANPSAGKFWTFRPAVQFSYIGNGWDVGTRVAYSYNTRNVETKYKSGSYINWDLAAMKSVSDSTRIGLAGYAVDQLNKDSTTLASAADYAATFGAANAQAAAAREATTLGQKGRVFGVGPEWAYIHGAGDYLLEARIMKEFGAQTRPKGFTAFLTLAKPF
jgi:hypothetical protein